MLDITWDLIMAACIVADIIVITILVTLSDLVFKFPIVN